MLGTSSNKAACLVRWVADVASACRLHLARAVTAQQARIGDYLIDGEPSFVGGIARFDATHIMLPRRAMLELAPRPSRTSRQSSVQMLRQACILEALHHPGVPRIYECGVLPDGRSWVASERISGRTLEHALRGGLLGVRATVALLEHIADVLAHAHARGVLHRDVTPSAVFIGHTERGFPLCVHGWRNARTLDTKLAPVPRGWDRYRAPELLQGEVIDARSDVFALGVLAYQALTGELPSIALVHRAPTIPLPLASLVEQMLWDDLAQRPTAIEVRDAARAMRSDVSAIAGRAAPGNDVSHEVRAKPRWTPPWQLSKSNPANPVVDPIAIRRQTDRR